MSKPEGENNKKSQTKTAVGSVGSALCVTTPFSAFCPNRVRTGSLANDKEGRLKATRICNDPGGRKDSLPGMNPPPPMATIVQKKTMDRKRGEESVCCLKTERLRVYCLLWTLNMNTGVEELKPSLPSCVQSHLCRLVRICCTNTKKRESCTHDVRLEIFVEMHRVHGLLDHGVDLVVANMNLAHRE